MKGILLVDKPAGWTSFDVVNFVRKAVARSIGVKPKQIKVGHSGTLDPFATGLLIVLVGKEYTRRASEFSKLDKTYTVTMQLGIISSTGDLEGELRSVLGPRPDLAALKVAASKFVGQIDQTPPVHSAIKINGQRAYKLARAGQKVELKPRSVIISRLQVTEYDYPDIKFLASVSSGTYIRSLVEDLGTALGSGAYTKELRRIKIGPFNVDDSVALGNTDFLQNLVEYI
jgi:tRNA pseudouridine55 synthase